jgi:hypothetical protein
VKDHVSADDYSHIQRILLDGSPGELTFDEPLANKTLMIQPNTGIPKASTRTRI